MPKKPALDLIEFVPIRFYYTGTRKHLNLFTAKLIGYNMLMNSVKLSAEDISKLKEKMHKHIQENCLITDGDFALSAGSGSSYYFDCKKATLDGAFLNAFAQYVCEFIVPQLPEQPDVVGGLTLGADFITAAIVMYSSANNGSIPQGSIVRKEPKKHGTKSRIENETGKDNAAGGKNVLVVEDVITSGASIAKACDEFLAAGYNPVGMLTVVDRDAGGIEALEKKYGIKVWALFSPSDFTI